MKKLKTLLNLWSQRCLSLKGRIAVLKSIILPQILYVATNLYVKESLQIEIDKLFFDFLWNGKKAHVKKEVIINEISKGGLKMPLFSGMVKGVKACWVKRLMNNEDRVNMVKKLIVYKNIDVQLVLSYKLDSKYIDVHSVFYKQIIDIWYHFYSKKPVTVNDIVNTSIFHNKIFLIDGKPVFYNQWYKAGIQVLGDILNANGQLLSKRRLEQKFNIEIKQMDYNSLIHCIPKEMLNSIKDKSFNKSLDSTVYVVINNKSMSLEKLKCKDIYWEYIREISEIPKAEKNIFT